eukprot:6204769-Pleurochrysis_carterae.AAC.2
MDKCTKNKPLDIPRNWAWSDPQTACVCSDCSLCPSLYSGTSSRRSLFHHFATQALYRTPRHKANSVFHRRACKGNLKCGISRKVSGSHCLGSSAKTCGMHASMHACKQSIRRKGPIATSVTGARGAGLDAARHSCGLPYLKEVTRESRTPGLAFWMYLARHLSLKATSQGRSPATRQC